MSRLAGVAGSGPGAFGAEGGTEDNLPASTIRLRILATTDLHAQLLSYDYYANSPQFGFGLTQTAALVAGARAEVPGSLLLDNGDFLQGSALADIASRPRRRRAHPAISAFAAMGYDAVALGNHEFNYGLDTLQAALRDAPFPALSANVARRLGPGPLQDDLLFAPYALIARDLTDARKRTHRIKVGVIGLTPPEILAWDKAKLAGRVEVRDMAEAARVWVPRMRAEGADVVVCLAHTGIAAPGHAAGDCRAVEIAGIRGIDALVAGHTHQVFPPPAEAAVPPVPPEAPVIDREAGRVAGKPVVQPGHSGSHLGIIDLWMQPGPGGWRVAQARSRAMSASEVVAGLTPVHIRTQAEVLRSRLSADHRAALAWTRRRLGETDHPLHSHFAQVADAQVVRLIAAAKVAHVRARLAGMPEGELPILATARAYRCGGLGGPLNFTDIPAGTISVRHVFGLYPFPNTIRAAVATGRDLRRRLERTAALLRQIRPGVHDQPIVGPDVPSFAYETIPGLSYMIDPTRPAGSRILDLRHGGRPVGQEDRFVLVMNSYIAGNADAPGRGLELTGDETLCTTAITEHIRRQGVLCPVPGEGWRLAPLPGTSVIYDSGAGALAHLDAVAHMRPEFLGVTPAGYHRFRLHL